MVVGLRSTLPTAAAVEEAEEAEVCSLAMQLVRFFTHPNVIGYSGGGGYGGGGGGYNYNQGGYGQQGS